MGTDDLKRWAERFVSGEWTQEEFREKLAGEFAAQKGDDTADTFDAAVDLDRHRRCGFPEVIYGEGKTTESITAIVRRLLDAGEDVLATRIDSEKARRLLEEFPEAFYHPEARTFRIKNPKSKPAEAQKQGKVAVISAGTSDLPVAAEALETALWTGASVVLIQDVGVAGPHRLRNRIAEFQDADAVVVVAGMEGALPSVVGGYVASPVIAVPTSVGYGAAFGGIAALLGMLNSCASNVTVVNIDAGFKAGYVAGLIARRTAQNR